MAKVSTSPPGDPIFELTSEEVQAKWSSLTPKEQSIARFYAFGQSNKAIAEAVGISLKTLDIHRANIVRKFATKPWGIGRVFFAARALNLPIKEAAA